MRRLTHLLLVCASVFQLAAGAPAVADDPIRAFPTAEGFGMYTAGGRGGRVLQVTSLADYDPKRAEPIPGTLRAACDARGPRTVVFRVSGTIELETGLIVTEPFLTLAGQTAPGSGICLKGYGTSIRTSEVIVRCLRFRPGDEAGKEVDALCVSSYKMPGDWPVRNVIVDHCSTSWATDEVLSVSGAGITGVTVQWCIISESLNRSVHEKGAHGYASLIKCNGDVTFHHNLYAHHSSRSPRPGTYGEGSILLDFRNNLIYNAYGYSAADPVRMNYVGNYIKHFKLDKAFSIGGPETKMYVSGNVMETAEGAEPGGWELISKAADENKRATPFDIAAVETHTAEDAYNRILRSSGASVPARDAVDTRVIGDVTAGTGRIIDSQTDVGGWPKLPSIAPPPDADSDGMPDAWETGHGLAPQSPDNNADLDGDGYTNLEEFLNFTDPHKSNK